jgi:hypothetical protein
MVAALVMTARLAAQQWQQTKQGHSQLQQLLQVLGTSMHTGSMAVWLLQSHCCCGHHPRCCPAGTVLC